MMKNQTIAIDRDASLNRNTIAFLCDVDKVEEKDTLRAVSGRRTLQSLGVFVANGRSSQNIQSKSCLVFALSHRSNKDGVETRDSL